MPEEGIKVCGTEITGGCEPPDVVLEIGPVSSPRAETLFSHRAISQALMHFSF